MSAGLFGLFINQSKSVRFWCCVKCVRCDFNLKTEKCSKLLGINVVLALIPWFILFLASPRGFDLTDESFHLLNHRHPTDVTATFSLFGVVISPLYYLSGTVTITRILGIVIWLVVATVATWKTLSFLAVRLALKNQSNWRLILFSLPPIAGATIYYYRGLFTPSYNWLTLVGLALFWFGFLMWLEPNRSSRETSVGAGLLGFAAMIVFWAKPTSAAMLPIFPITALMFNWSDWRRLLRPQTIAWGVVGLGVPLSIPFLHGFTPHTLFETFNRGIEHQQLMKPGLYDTGAETLLAGVEQSLIFASGNLYFPILILFVSVTVFSIFLRLYLYPKYNNLHWIQFLLALIWIANLLVMTFILREIPGYWGLNLVLSTLLFVWGGRYTYRIVTKSKLPDDGRLWGGLWIIPILGLIFIFVFGTNNSYDHQSGLATYFYLLSVVVLFLVFDDNPINTVLVQIAIPTLLLAIAVIVFIHSLTPHRQNEAIWAMSHPIVLNQETETLIVSQETARYFTELKALANSADFQSDTPIIDLTGHSPGAVYLLEARAYGFPWLLGGYPGSDPAAVYILKQWKPKQLSEAWILTVEANGERPLSLSVLSKIGLDFPEGYIKVGTVRRAASREIQALWRPI